MASIVFSLVVLEFSYRFYLFGWSSFSIMRTNSVNSLGRSGLLQKSDHPELGWELKPNLDTYFKLAHFKTNSEGLRDTEHAFEKPGNTYRIAVVGDSFSMPSGVQIDDSYHQLLEQLLNDDYFDREYEIINFSVGGYSLNQYLGVIRYRAIDYDPDLILVGFCPENDERVPRHQFNPPFLDRPRKYPFFHSFVKDLFTTSVKRNPESQDRKKIFNDKEVSYMTRVFSEMDNFSLDHDIPIVVVFLSNRKTNFRRSYSDGMEKIVTDCGLQYSDVSAAFEGEDVKDFQIYPTDYHPNKAANLRFAQQLYGCLSKTLKMNSLT